MAQGHLPGETDFGRRLTRAIDYVLSCEQRDGWLHRSRLNRNAAPPHTSAHTVLYNHGIAGTFLCEAYGMVDPEKAAELHVIIRRAIQASLRDQQRPKRLPADRGGWRYLVPIVGETADSDVSATAWQLTFLRAAKNAGFDVPEESVRLARLFIKSRYDTDKGNFRYAAFHPQESWHVTNGTGILALSLGGDHNSNEARGAARWLMARPFRTYADPAVQYYHYAAFLCSMATFQLGGQDWEAFFPRVTRQLVSNQRQNGSWRCVGPEELWGDAFATASAILALASPNQVIPVYQR